MEKKEKEKEILNSYVINENDQNDYENLFLKLNDIQETISLLEDAYLLR